MVLEWESWAEGRKNLMTIKPRTQDKDTAAVSSSVKLTL